MRGSFLLWAFFLLSLCRGFENPRLTLLEAIYGEGVGSLFLKAQDEDSEASMFAHSPVQSMSKTIKTDQIQTLDLDDLNLRLEHLIVIEMNLENTCQALTRFFSEIKETRNQYDTPVSLGISTMHGGNKSEELFSRCLCSLIQESSTKTTPFKAFTIHFDKNSFQKVQHRTQCDPKTTTAFHEHIVFANTKGNRVLQVLESLRSNDMSCLAGSHCIVPVSSQKSLMSTNVFVPRNMIRKLNPVIWQKEIDSALAVGAMALLTMNEGDIVRVGGGFGLEYFPFMNYAIKSRKIHVFEPIPEKSRALKINKVAHEWEQIEIIEGGVTANQKGAALVFVKDENTQKYSLLREATKGNSEIKEITPVPGFNIDDYLQFLNKKLLSVHFEPIEKQYEIFSLSRFLFGEQSFSPKIVFAVLREEKDQAQMSFYRIFRDKLLSTELLPYDLAQCAIIPFILLSGKDSEVIALVTPPNQAFFESVVCPEIQQYQREASAWVPNPQKGIFMNKQEENSRPQREFAFFQEKKGSKNEKMLTGMLRSTKQIYEQAIGVNLADSFLLTELMKSYKCKKALLYFTDKDAKAQAELALALNGNFGIDLRVTEQKGEVIEHLENQELKSLLVLNGEASEHQEIVEKICSMKERENKPPMWLPKKICKEMIANPDL